MSADVTVDGVHSTRNDFFQMYAWNRKISDSLTVFGGSILVRSYIDRDYLNTLD